MTTVGDPDRGVGVRSERETQMDWNIIEGKKDRVVGKLQQKYGYAADEAARRADEWAKQQDAKPQDEATKT